MLGVTDPTINVVKNKSQYFLTKGLEKLYNSFWSKLFLAIVFNYYPPPTPTPWQEAESNLDFFERGRKFV